MKNWILSLALIASPFAASAHDHASVHGMLVFGENQVYLSHLPMFHPPHDYQALMVAELGAEMNQVYQKSLAEDKTEKVYTLVPEAFVLPDMIAQPKPFKATLYKGHFERGGQPIATSLSVKITKIIYFKKLAPNAPTPIEPNYLLFGSVDEPFVAHVIAGQPSFDQIAAPQLTPAALKALSENESVVGPLSWLGKILPFYTETGDLE